MTQGHRALEWLARRRSGESIALIAHRAGVTPATVRYATRPYGPFPRATQQLGRVTSSSTASQRARRWVALRKRGMTVAEIAEAEGMGVTQVRRVMRLTLLAPEVVERLVGSPDAVLEKVMRRPWPNGWGDQMRVLVPPG